MPAVPQHFFLHLLSDRTHRLAALRFVPAATGDGELAAALAPSRLAELAAGFPCLLAPEDAAAMPAGELDAFRAAGGRIAAAGEIHFAASGTTDPLPASARYVAGNWFELPPAKPSTTLNSSRTMAMKLVQLVAADADNHEIEEIFRREPALSYQLLRLVNSPGISTGRHITSFAQAIMVLGRRQLRRWLNLLLFSPQKEDPRSALLLARVSVRASKLELLARETGSDKDTQERAFMIGMLSQVGVLLGQPLAEILRPLCLDNVMQAALLGKEGFLGHLLAAAEAAEQGDQAALAAALSRVPPPHPDLDRLEVESNLWMLALTLGMEGDSHG